MTARKAACAPSPQVGVGCFPTFESSRDFAAYATNQELPSSDNGADTMIGAGDARLLVGGAAYFALIVALLA